MKKIIIVVVTFMLLFTACSVPPENSCKWCFLEKSDYVSCYCNENGTAIREDRRARDIISKNSIS